MAQLTSEQFDGILGAADQIRQLKEQTGLDVSILSTQGVEGYTVVISKPEDKKPPLIMQELGDGDIRSTVGRLRFYSPKSALEYFQKQIRRNEDGEQ